MCWSRLHEFGDLFTLVDTVRFDASVLIGSISFVDQSDREEFLVTDGVMRLLYVFTASGRHVRTIDIAQCNPEDSSTLLTARFLKNGSMIAMTYQGVYYLDTDGSCKQRLLEVATNDGSFCERQDTVYFLHPWLRLLRCIRFPSNRVLLGIMILGNPNSQGDCH